jgi:hypothetical protein
MDLVIQWAKMEFLVLVFLNLFFIVLFVLGFSFVMWELFKPKSRAGVELTISCNIKERLKKEQGNDS